VTDHDASLFTPEERENSTEQLIAALRGAAGVDGVIRLGSMGDGTADHTRYPLGIALSDMDVYLRLGARWDLLHGPGVAVGIGKKDEPAPRKLLDVADLYSASQ
jgi:hypothetical protein